MLTQGPYLTLTNDWIDFGIGVDKNNELIMYMR